VCFRLIKVAAKSSDTCSCLFVRQQSATSGFRIVSKTFDSNKARSMDAFLRLLCAWMFIFLLVPHHARCGAEEPANDETANRDTVTSDQENARRQIASLNSSSKHFRDEVAFVCTFAYDSGQAKTWDDAWANANKELPLKNNQIAKMGADFCLIMGDQDGGAASRFSQVGMLSSSGIQFVVNLTPGNYQLIAPGLKEKDRFLSMWIDPVSFSPFFMQGGKFGEIVPPLMPHLSDKVLSIDNVSIDVDGRIVVLQELSAKNPQETKAKVINRLTFEVFEGVPALVSHVYKELNDLDDLDGPSNMRSLCELRGHVDCGGVYMASSVSRVMGPLPSGQFLYWNWKSDDLGQRGPIETDFVVEVDKSIRPKRGFEFPDDRKITRSFLQEQYSQASNNFEASLTLPAPNSTSMALRGIVASIGRTRLVIAGLTATFFLACLAWLAIRIRRLKTDVTKKELEA